MCLTLAVNHNKPHNSSKVRWKLMRCNPATRNKLVSIYEHKRYEFGKWYKARDVRGGANKEDIGFHVFSSKAGLLGYIDTSGRDEPEYYVIVRVLVDDFVASGHYTIPAQKMETWKKMKITGVFDLKFNPMKKKGGKYVPIKT